MNSKNRIVVLGAGGFVGGCIYNFLKKNKFFVIPIDRNKIDFLRNNSSKLLKNLVKKNDIIINSIAIAPCKTFSDFLKNLSIIDNIQNALAGREIKKYINISSDAVYGDKKTRISEQDIPRPTTLHGLMHYNREIIIDSTIGKTVKVIHLRPTLIYGVSDPHSGYGPNLFFKNFINKEDISIFGNGEELRDHIFINDVAKIVSRIISKNIDSPLNLVSGVGITFYQIARIFQKIDESVVIRKIERKFKKPHDGYRLFNNLKFKKFFPKYKMESIKKNIYEMTKNRNVRN